MRSQSVAGRPSPPELGLDPVEDPREPALEPFVAGHLRVEPADEGFGVTTVQELLDVRELPGLQA
ncbi:hypothetical protein HNR40_000257 [Nonomuraea endophytica]|uniref:Uncharacterized protein n=1 Tax=Nonomuraea endophytica TaxID=714136 RepID=A0A7W7ZWV4_9ACTN|nr:hypothetical protein [Nonomuraea endophytica]MBB5074811.1 hypothetical protein [Nonomuraea endophytica]